MALENDTLAPDFELANQFGELIRLSDFRGTKPVALMFFPLAFSQTCTSELCELRDNLALFRDSNVELLAISVDSKSTLRAFADAEGFDFTLLADFWPHGSVAKEFGVFVEQKGYATRATFLIDTAGIIRASFHSTPGQARELAAYRAALAALLSTPTPRP
ncbi:MAG: peroxiredoxin [Microbacteriaceae bacterium]|nr:peroxiredoxin [Microbacteriaceae bacterium]